MEAEDLLDKFAQDEGFGNWETVVLNCHHSVIRSVAIAAVNEALHQPLVVWRSEQLKALLSKVVNEFDSGEVTWDTRDEIESILKSL
jgi:hypothetical protein